MLWRLQHPFLPLRLLRLQRVLLLRDEGAGRRRQRWGGGSLRSRKEARSTHLALFLPALLPGLKLVNGRGVLVVLDTRGKGHRPDHVIV